MSMCVCVFVIKCDFCPWDYVLFCVSVCVCLFYCVCVCVLFIMQGEDIGLFITRVPKSDNNILLFVGFGDFLLKFYWLVQVECPNVSKYRRGNIVFHHWECTLIYRSLSYSLRSLVIMCGFYIVCGN